MKNLFFILLLFYPISLFAQTLQSGSYACNGTTYTMQITSLFGTAGASTLYNKNKIVSNATIKITGDNIAFSFITGGETYQGKTWIYKITSATSFEGNSEMWLKVADGRYQLGPAAPATGSITNPYLNTDNNSTYTLKSGNYSMSGSRQNIYISFNGRRGRGNLRDENGAFDGEFRAEIKGDMLSITFTNGKFRDITYDYKVLNDTSFSRFGELWVRRY
ncbi:MAG: hypothetical protein Ta2B_14920 [Termitinemataceae bacterium]|nr:MAG: hypothetical protein Ta2B_14920 [Termitinemataceae bacterium]